ncbi:hypothetical protein HNO92_003198 [Chromobacterium alkanivorans]|uniref:hypothetical protein n=1 Tax=Chromobacterium alkanivorans TaxID=1071719 RepID=UPI00216900F5|nr:hypothetical protein [Chromobacterium alkanivorans]MCS3805661.1 hypothetical protein [Chromobacterium alkanivorans]MCS3820109.1 hypothetical protein [Chromobacterium alkanivorans]MCS3874866.1 hypothetical protein [Chromobacterium alkanivorans]
MRSVLPFAAILSMFCAAPALAGAPPALVVTGQIKVSNQTRAGEYHFSKADLERLQQRTIQTKTTWTPKSAFTGPTLSAILRAVGATGRPVEVVTEDQYKVVIPPGDQSRYQPILALRINGRPLEEMGFSQWMMYPLNDFRELQTADIDAKLAWRVKALVVR